MRILMLDNEFPPLGGGMGTANQALLQRYAALPGLEIDLVTSALGGRFESEQWAERIRMFRVPVWNRNLHHSTNRELVTYAVRALPVAARLHRRRRYDLCFAWSTVPAGGVALVLDRLFNLPYGVWLSGPDIPGWVRRYRTEYLLLSPLIRWVWRCSSTVVGKCREEITRVHSLEGRANATLIPNGVDLTTFRPGPPVPDSGPLHVICVGRLIKHKGQNHLIEAAKHLLDDGTDIKVTLVGTGDAQDAYEAQARQLGVDHCVCFTGYVPRAEIARRFASAHVFVLPSYGEGMSIAVLEAMASGLPVIVTRTGGTDELVEEGVNGLTFEWGDVDALVAHVGRLSADRDLARRMGAESRTRAERFSWDAIAERYLELFATVAFDGAE